MLFEELAKDAGMTLVPFSSPDLTGGITVPSFSTDRLNEGLKILMKVKNVPFAYTKDAGGWRFYENQGDPR